jgi:N-acetylmuramic acid 6-phosphate etherase
VASAAERQAPRPPTFSSESLAHALLDGQVRAIDEVRAARATLQAAASRVALTLRAPGRIIYAGAGSSGWLAMQDGLELPGTFGIDADRIAFVTPEGDRIGIDSAGEDDGRAAERAIDALGAGPSDLVIAVSASGTTPFTLAAARRAKDRQGLVVAIVCRGGSPLAALADIAVDLDTGPEAVEGSTRLAAGTAQKAALGVISTLAAAELGLVHDGLMINLRPENAKLRVRAAGIVARIARVDEHAAAHALRAAREEVPVAIAIAAGRLERVAAAALVSECGGNVSEVLMRLSERQGR